MNILSAEDQVPQQSAVRGNLAGVSLVLGEDRCHAVRDGAYAADALDDLLGIEWIGRKKYNMA